MIIPSQIEKKDTLTELRQRIDAVDDAIIALLIERTHIVETVGKLKADEGKGTSFIRPGREAMMLRRLMEKIKGHFPKAAVAVLWRTIIAASLNIEQKLVVSAHVLDGNRDAYWYSREYFGAFTSISSHHTASQVINDITKGKANVGVLSLPQGNDASLWWSEFNPAQHNMHVFACIPFVHCLRAESYPKLVTVANVFPEPTGEDVTLLVLAVSASVSQGKIIRLFEEHGFQAEYLASTEQNHGVEVKKHLIEINGFLMHDQEKINQLVKMIDKAASAVLLGAYSVPITV